MITTLFYLYILRLIKKFNFEYKIEHRKQFTYKKICACNQQAPMSPVENIY